MKTVVITGSNRGIGLEFCKHFSDAKWDVIAVCRKESPQLTKLGVRIENGIDVSSPEDVSRLAETLIDTKIDLLINNAGILSVESLENFSGEPIARQFEVNSIAPLRLSIALLKSLSTGSKIAMITSRMGSVADNDSGGYYGYRMSKAALNCGAVSLSLDLAKQGIHVGIYHPGYVKTEMTGNQGLIDTKESVKGICRNISTLGEKTSGKFFHTNGEALEW